MCRPVLPVCMEEGGTTPHVEEEGKGEGKGRGACSKRGRGYATPLAYPLPPCIPPFPRITRDTHRCVVYM